jgi:hypothetical protein
MKALILGSLLFAGCTIVGVPSVDVSGTVSSPEGQPIKNATVVLVGHHFSLWCCQYHGIIALTRTNDEGRYRFVGGADRALHFPADSWNYRVYAVHDRFLGSDVWPVDAPLSAPLNVVLKPKGSKADYTAGDCIHLCPGARFDDCRRAAEFHFGDKTRCDGWREEFSREYGTW